MLLDGNPLTTNPLLCGTVPTDGARGSQLNTGKRCSYPHGRAPGHCLFGEAALLSGSPREAAAWERGRDTDGLTHDWSCARVPPPPPRNNVHTPPPLTCPTPSQGVGGVGDRATAQCVVAWVTVL